MKRLRPETPSSEASWLKRRRQEVSAAAAAAGELTPTRRLERPDGWSKSHEKEFKRLRHVCTGRAVEALLEGHLLQEEAKPALLKGMAQEERMHAKYDEARRWRRRQEQLGQLDRLLDRSKLLWAAAWVQTTSGRARAQALEHVASRGCA